MRFAAALFALLLGVAAAARGEGSLVIAGGALEAGSPVYAAFAAALAGKGPVLVIPAAGGSPVQSGIYFTEQMTRAGLDARRIRVLPVAVADDAATPDVDESSWAANAARPELLEGLDQAAGVWFTGGDQMRIVRTLVDAEGRATPLLELIRRRHAEGAVVGGSSAGAAIMSDAMISGGDGFRSLLEPLASVYPESEADDTGRLWLARGLGFFDGGLVDQHFDRQARLGRLVRALGETRDLRGFGVDENTALLVEPDRRSARVLGSGAVTVLDAEDARFDFAGATLASGLRLSLFPAGVRFALDTLEPLEGQGEPLAGRESYSHRPLEGGGVAFPNARLEEMLGYDLVDNSTVRSLSRHSVDGTGRGLVFRFARGPASRGWCCGISAQDRYTVSGVVMDVLRQDASRPARSRAVLEHPDPREAAP
jgi:cyanophycinase